jgi:hypothetical protein
VLIYADRRYVGENRLHIPMLIPFWGQYPDDGDPSDVNRFDRYAAAGRRYFDLAPLERADIAVWPADWDFEQPDPRSHELAAAAGARNVPLVIFFGGDPTAPIVVENSVIFRNSIDRSSSGPNEFALPGFCQDLVTAYCGGQVPLRPYRELPIVGFCGHAMGFKEGVRYQLLTRLPAPAVRRLVRLGLQPSVAPGRVLRTHALRALAGSPDVRTHFLVRRLFWNGVFAGDGRMDVRLARQSRQEFVQNLLDSDYALCVRGFGNYSYRLYEALCLGRIPVLVDTDCALPYDRWIDWKQYMVWIDQSEVHEAPRRVAAFHASLTAAAFTELQKACRQLWGEWLSPEGYFANFHRHFGD